MMTTLLMMLAVLPMPIPDAELAATQSDRPPIQTRAEWQKWGNAVPEVVPCASCPSGQRYTGRQYQYWRDGQGNQAVGILDASGQLAGWVYHWRRPDGTFRSDWAPADRSPDALARWQSGLAPEDRRAVEAYHWRLSPGSCGMLGCVVHGGGWRLVPAANCPTCPR